MSGVRVLLIDDDDVEREMLQRAVVSGIENCKIRSATSAVSALEFIGKNTFDIILMDYHMPGLNGIEAIGKIRGHQHLKHAPIVIISNNDNEELALECINAGAQDFLLKSKVSAEQLSRAINQSKCRFKIEQALYDDYQHVKHLAEIDRLTGLHNRYYYDESLAQMLKEQKREPSLMVAVMLIDLDKFKQINDNYGHDIGDQLLVEVSGRIRNVLRENELFARLGGDEFALACANIKSIRKVKNIARRILKTFDSPFIIDGHQLFCAGSIGVAISPINGNQQKELMRLADIAMYRAKKLDMDKICVFEDNMELAFLKRYHIESELRTDISTDNTSLSVEYLPIVNQKLDTIVGLEALVRWTREGIVRMPNEFIAIAEESGLIRPLGKWILHNILSTLGSNTEIKNKQFSIAINVSAQQLDDPTFLGFVEKSCKEFRFPPKLLTIEVNEKAFLDKDPITVDTLSGLSNLGVKIALDDFGAELAPLTHLTKWPINQVKIDRGIIQSLTIPNSKQRATLEGIIGLLEKLQIEPIAVGVETLEQSRICHEIGLENVQGFLHFKPLSSHEARLLVCNQLPNIKLKLNFS